MRDGSNASRRANIALALGLAVALELAATVACSGQSGPSDEALARYAGTADATAATTNGTSPATASGADASPVLGPRARRVSITVERAVGVPDNDPGPGTSDPYVLLSYEGTRFKTSVVEGSETPVWGDSTVIDVRPGGVLEVTLFDEDSLSSDEKLGIQTVPLPDLAVGETKALAVAFKAGKAGTVTLTLTGLARP